MYYNRLECVNTLTGEPFTVWQRVESDAVTAYVDANGDPIKMPKVYEGQVVAAELERPE